ncbi:MAG: hypothetical protein ACRENG_23255 [bacterium]
MKKLLAEIYHRNRVLAITGWFHVGLLAVMLCIAPFDSRTVMGLNPWIKPMKFAASITLYLWTLAWFLKYLPGPRWAIRMISWGASFVMIVEIVCITMQAARGTTSHYNEAMAFDAVVFSIMGGMILLNTLLAALLLVLFFTQRIDLAPAYFWGIRLGTVVLILGSIEGMIMIFNQAHTVGLPDGGPGLPLVNWSTRAGDLRVAHMLGLHAFQIFPLFGYAISRWKRDRPVSQQIAYLFAFVLIYTSVTVFTFWQAMNGRPLVAL